MKTSGFTHKSHTLGRRGKRGSLARLRRRLRPFIGAMMAGAGISEIRFIISSETCEQLRRVLSPSPRRVEVGFLPRERRRNNPEINVLWLVGHPILAAESAGGPLMRDGGLNFKFERVRA